MHLPPAARVHIARSRAHFLMLVGWAAAYAGLLGALMDAIQPWAWAGLALACLLIATYALWRWWSSPVGTLAWSGREWTWQQTQEKQPCSVCWRADFQSLVLLELQWGKRRRVWVWVERNVMSAVSWLVFRRALVAGKLALDAQMGDGTDFSNDYLKLAQQPHIQSSRYTQGANDLNPGIQNSTQR